MTLCREAEIFTRLGLPGLELLSVLELESDLVQFGPTRLIDLILRKWSAPDSAGALLSNYIKDEDRPSTNHSDWSFLDEAQAELTPERPESDGG